jgi:hypothetical protein
MCVGIQRLQIFVQFQSELNYGYFTAIEHDVDVSRHTLAGTGEELSITITKTSKDKDDITNNQNCNNAK